MHIIPLCCVSCDAVQELEVKVEEWMARYEEDTEAKSKELEDLKVDPHARHVNA